jgi:hypothetical protein
MSIKRRSFLAMLGFAPVAIATKAEPITPANPEIVEAAAEGVVMASVRVPVKIGLTQEQADFCSEIGMDVHEYAKNLHELKKLGFIEGEVNTTVLYEENKHDHIPS